MRELIEAKENILREIDKCNSKMRGGGKMAGEDAAYIDHLTHAMKNIATVEAMEGSREDGYSEGMSYAGNYSEARGRRYARRDSMGRYSSAEEEDQMLDMVERMSGSMSGEKRQAAERFLREMRR